MGDLRRGHNGRGVSLGSKTGISREAAFDSSAVAPSKSPIP
jgi:hypothetical protein